ncbi:odorant receptor 67a-like [Scaptodrosophila lebanonensis]|uniref:Odorant receptor n=1 Tax=Drosophila lebanonensis TaxID=7225 RepID=A0A6J2TMR5_DROLE|nr:odorant receptor 67a-like [Scaptodrosophila lebanonensis]
MAQKLVVFDDFMGLAVFLLNSIGVVPYEKKGSSTSFKVWIYVSFVLNLANLSFGIWNAIVFIARKLKQNEEFFESIMVMSYLGFAVGAQCQIVSLWWNKKKLTSLVNQLQSMFPSRESDQQLYRARVYSDRAGLITKTYSALHVIVIQIYSLWDIAFYLLNWPNGTRSLPFAPDVPWVWQDNWTFYLIYFMEAFQGYSAVLGHMSNNLLIFNIATQLIMHFDYMAESIEKYKPQAHLSKDGYAKDLKQLQSWLIYHNKMFRLADQMNEVFGVPLLLTFFASSGGMCFLGFEITIGISPELMVKVAVFLATIVINIFLLCVFSQQLIDASTKISEAVYNMDWPAADVRYQKMLVVMAQRAQQPVSLRATIFVAVSMSTMTDFMQLSYKFLALLRTMYN